MSKTTILLGKQHHFGDNPLLGERGKNNSFGENDI